MGAAAAEAASSPVPHQRREPPGAPRRRQGRRIADEHEDLAPRQLAFPAASFPFPLIPEEVEPEFQVLAPPTDHTVVGDCSVCLTSIPACQAINLTCSHVFHLNCINAWRRVQGYDHAQCPLCRRRLQQLRTVARAPSNVVVDLTRDD